MGNCEAILAKSPPSGYLTKTVQCLLTGICGPHLDESVVSAESWGL